MANPVLLRSSLAFTVAHVAALLTWGWSNCPWLAAVYVLGCFTSILNHALTSEFWRWFDRLVMVRVVPVSCEHVLKALHLELERQGAERM